MAKKPSLSIVRSNSTGLQPPRKLGKAGMSLWQAVQREYRIADVGGIELLAQGCGAVDRLEAIRELIDDEGEIIHSRTGFRANPLLREELGLRSFICRTLERLGITQEKIKTPGRPGSFVSAWSGDDADGDE